MNTDDTIIVTEQKDGFWLYDTTRGMNLSMRAKSKDDAFIQALKYYQKRLLNVETRLHSLQDKIDLFVLCVSREDDV